MGDPEDSADDANKIAELKELKLQLDIERENLERKYKDAEIDLHEKKTELKDSIDWLNQSQKEELENLESKQKEEQTTLLNDTLQIKNQKEELERQLSEFERSRKEYLDNRSSNEPSDLQIEKEIKDKMQLLDGQLEIKKEEMDALNQRQSREKSSLFSKHKNETESMQQYIKEEEKRIDDELTDLAIQRERDLAILERKYDLFSSHLETRTPRESESQF